MDPISNANQENNANGTFAVPTMSNMPVMNPAMAAAPAVEPVPAVPAMPNFNEASVNVTNVANPAAQSGADSLPLSGAMPDLAAATMPAAPTASAAPAAPVAPTAPVNPLPPVMPEVSASAVNGPAISPDFLNMDAYQAAGVGLSDTAPLTRPEMPKTPDPVEEELKMPLKPAEPVPGSIGSAVSGPATRTPSVAFNDPAMAEDMAKTNLPDKKSKKSSGKMNKTTLILLCVVGGLVIVALIAVLVMQLNGVL